MFHTAPHKTVQNMAPVASFRTIIPSTAMTGTMTTKQVNPYMYIQILHVRHHWDIVHCPQVNSSGCKPGESLALRKVKHPHNKRTSVNRLPLTKQDFLSQYSSCIEGIGQFTGTHTNFTSNQNTSLHDMHQGKFQSTLKLLLRRKLNF